MNIKNYTSQVPAYKSIMRIEELLVQAGATHVSKTYLHREVSGFLFQIPVNGSLVVFKMPCQTEAVYHYLENQQKSTNQISVNTLRSQANRIAWKLLKDWVQIQFSLIELKMVDLAQVFLPYAYDASRDQTYYDKMKNGEINLLG